jgi:hypothetical protein
MDKSHTTAEAQHRLMLLELIGCNARGMGILFGVRETRMPPNWTAFVARCGFPKVQGYFLPSY